MNRRMFVLSALAATGCATVPAEAPAPPVLAPGETLPELEAVSAVVGREGLRLTVASNGCTGKADWAVWREPRGEAVALAFARRRLDLCRGLPGGTAELAYSWPELGIAPGARIVLLNPSHEP
ncbi:hypothetical protein [Phenylobacterium sp. J367]|uniref:hypothetical protein n=1 Tax=Phenylobacterium sp. J367 TaxID=2898435 RepID=UPI002151D709|nr:hypothetical protein [Phenylobacterium sp. J367]MCR5879154.1 hypothetical protein [Phenylobacterium sp. J367]